VKHVSPWFIDLMVAAAIFGFCTLIVKSCA
jgi:hypothetical protein